MSRNKPRSIWEVTQWWIVESCTGAQREKWTEQFRKEGYNVTILDHFREILNILAIDKDADISYDDLIYDNMDVIKELTCKRCGHRWMPRKIELPTQCPRCKSYYWNKDRKKGGK